MAPLFQSELDELMNNQIIANSHSPSSISKNSTLNRNPALLLSDSAKKLASQPLFAHQSSQKTSIFDQIPLNQNPFVQSQTQTSSYDHRLQEKTQMLNSHRFLKFSSYYKDEYSELDHEGEYEEVKIGEEIYRFKKKKPTTVRKRSKYRPLPPAPKRIHVSHEPDQLTSSNFQQTSTFNDNESSFGGSSLNLNPPYTKNSMQSDCVSQASTEKRKVNRGVIYEKYSWAANEEPDSGKSCQRVVTYPKAKETLPPYLKRIKDQLKKKYKQVFEDDQSQSSSNSSEECDEKTKEKKIHEKELKKEKKQKKQQGKRDLCEIVGVSRIHESHRWGTREEFEKFLKKKEYEERIKKMNEERMKKMLISKKVSAKIEKNKEKHKTLAAFQGDECGKKKSENRKKLVVVSLDSENEQKEGQKCGNEMKQSKEKVNLDKKTADESNEKLNTIEIGSEEEEGGDGCIIVSGDQLEQTMDTNKFRQHGQRQKVQIDKSHVLLWKERNSLLGNNRLSLLKQRQQTNNILKLPHGIAKDQTVVDDNEESTWKINDLFGPISNDEDNIIAKESSSPNHDSPQNLNKLEGEQYDERFNPSA